MLILSKSQGANPINQSKPSNLSHFHIHCITKIYNHFSNRHNPQIKSYKPQKTNPPHFNHKENNRKKTQCGRNLKSQSNSETLIEISTKMPNKNDKQTSKDRQELPFEIEGKYPKSESLLSPIFAFIAFDFQESFFLFLF